MHKEVLTVYISMTMGCTSFLLLDKGTKAATTHICLERVAAAFLYNYISSKHKMEFRKRIN